MPAPRFPRPVHVGSPNVGDRARFHELVDEILDRNWLTNAGPVVLEFERRIAEHLGVKHCIATCNGTAALEIAIRCLGLTGEVVLPSYTFVATAHAVKVHGGTPVFADIDPETHNIDPEAARARISDRTCGIVGVHLWGRPAPVAALQQLADEAGIPLLFDAAHAFNVTSAGRMIGGNGSMEVLSFHATKFFNTMEGGAITTNDDDLAADARLRRNFGFAGFDNVVALGINAKMTEVCAAMGLVNLDAVDQVVSINRANHAAYSEALGAVPGLQVLQYDPAERNNYQYVVLEVGPEFGAGRDAVVDHLHANNVLARKYFWPGCHRMQPYRRELAQHLPHLRRTEEVAARVVVLPTGTAVTPQDCRTIAELVLECSG